MNDFYDIMKSRASDIEFALSEFVPAKNNYQKIIYEAMRYSLLGGGKRLRGILCLTGGLIAGGTKEQVMPFACAVEMVHAYSLIHDDLPAMDNDDFRRGKPSCHKQFDEATAILAGDALLNGAFELILDRSTVTPEKTLAALKILSDASGADGMIGGQTVDIMYTEKDKELTYEQLLYLHKLKTGALISASLMCGFTACGGDAALMPRLREYAAKIGLAFQVVDDILDVTGDEITLGKPVGSDDKNHKNTFISFMGPEGSKEFAAKLSRDAALAVEDLGEEGKFLAFLAEYLCDRKF